MTVKELKEILKRVSDNTHIEVIRTLGNGQRMHLPVDLVTYDKKWDTLQFNIE